MIPTGTVFVLLHTFKGLIKVCEPTITWIQKAFSYTLPYFLILQQCHPCVHHAICKYEQYYKKYETEACFHVNKTKDTYTPCITHMI